MPRFLVNTNVAKADVPAVLLSEATDELVKAMGIPAQVETQPFSLVYSLKINFKWVIYFG